MSDEFIFQTQHQQERAQQESFNLAPPTDPIEISLDDSLQKELDKIPDKMAFKIGEVADLVGVKTYVLRYWETEFDILKPKKSRHNQRVYGKKDVEMAMTIRKLLHDDRFSIEGARTALKKMRKSQRKVDEIRKMTQDIEGIRDKVESLMDRIHHLRSNLQSMG